MSKVFQSVSESFLCLKVEYETMMDTCSIVPGNCSSPIVAFVVQTLCEVQPSPPLVGVFSVFSFLEDLF